MPARAYTGVTLDLDPAVHDFIATATVSGSDALGERGKATALGTFTLFDLASQRLSRDTTIPLEESTFKFLHVELSVSSAPGSAAARFVPAMVLGRRCRPAARRRRVYTTVAETASIATVGREIGGHVCGSGAGPGGAGVVCACAGIHGELQPRGEGERAGGAG